ncbi:hypothetical protein LOTGIDRAFT_190371 [Lottia gigantea]|uniref:Splicing factor 3A subunit 1 n=1 Tax=Lottia gigantea TaxID=225164 RepID=V4BV28_LOTGI|nr:hypothetical protein LOTGIDRAFT_190371 [Lottia gigantea]ESO92859.1 hypothetical protein LOTGIDRAFT_190371 [Lottia gigantea]
MPALEAVRPHINDGEIDIEKERIPPPSKPVIGIIYPPPEVRNIVDKTASFVARNGPEFENRIRQNEVNNPKFNFLNENDAYHAYYQHKVKEFKEGRGQEPVAPKPGFQSLARQPQEQSISKISEVFVPKDPPAEFEFIVDPPSISAYDLDVVKLTAQFVARNGRQFLTTVMQREQRNYLFDFLRPQHSLFNYFTKLVEQYTKILIPPKNLREKLAKDCESYKTCLDQVKYRVEWAKHQDREKRKEEEAQEKERVAYASVDWHDFVVVETVDFQPNEQGNLPPPTTPDEVGARMLAQERLSKKAVDPDEMDVESDDESEPGSPTPEEPAPPKLPPPPKDNRQLQDMDEESDDEMHAQRRSNAPPPPPPPPSDVPPMPPTPGNVIIKKNYDPKARAVVTEQPSDQFMISPITGEKVPTDKVPEHMRIGLLNPKWIEDRQRTLEEKREQEEVYAAGSSIDINLKQLAERRTDIFGVGTEETQIGKKIGEEEQKDRKIVWDGHTASMEKVSQKARENISIEEQIATIHKVKGLLPDEEKEKIGPAMPKNAPPLPKSRPPPPSSQPPPLNPPPQSRPPLPPQPPLMAAQPLMQPNLMVLQQRPPMPIIGIPAPPPLVRQPMSIPTPQRFTRPTAPVPNPKKASDDEPPNKKAKTEDNLIPEDVFLKRNKGPVKISVSVPNVSDKPEWSLNGQKLDFTLPLTDSVSVIKAKLNEALGMPAGKQKLQFDGIFIKDSNTLAFYNFTNGAVVDLQVKERGGRKK